MKKETRSFISALLLWFYLGSLSDVRALEVETAKNPQIPQEVRYLRWPTEEAAAQETIFVHAGTSQVLRFDRVITRISISDPGVCDIIALSTREILIVAKRPGNPNLLVWDESYNIAVYSLRSILRIEKLYEALQGIDPTAEIRVIPFKDTVAVYGTAETSEKVRLINFTVSKFDANGISYVKVKEPKQILLEVRFAEVDRRASKTYGLDVDIIDRFASLYSFGGQTGASRSGSIYSSSAGDGFRAFGGRADFIPIEGPDSAEDAVIGGAYVSKKNAVQAFLDWLIQKNILKLIARPNLLAKDGELANFIVGGESPYITTTQSSVNVAYKEFGTRLAFVPEVLEDKVIRLRVDTEVSELDFSTTVSLQGTTAPTIVKTTHHTVAELRDNESLVIGGLIFQRINKVLKKVPLFGDIPFLSRFFRREEFSRRDVELLIVVTPHLVKPFETGEKKKFFPEDKALEAVQIFTPPFPDTQADLINELIIQEESRQIFEAIEKKKAKAIEKEIEKIKAEEIQKSEASSVPEPAAAPDSPAPVVESIVFAPQAPTSASAEESVAEEEPLTGGNRGIFPSGYVQ